MDLLHSINVHMPISIVIRFCEPLPSDLQIADVLQENNNTVNTFYN